MVRPTCLSCFAIWKTKSLPLVLASPVCWQNPRRTVHSKFQWHLQGYSYTVVGNHEIQQYSENICEGWNSAELFEDLNNILFAVYLQDCRLLDFEMWQLLWLCCLKLELDGCHRQNINPNPFKLSCQWKDHQWQLQEDFCPVEGGMLMVQKSSEIHSVDTMFRRSIPHDFGKTTAPDSNCI